MKLTKLITAGIAATTFPLQLLLPTWRTVRPGIRCAC